MAIATVRRTGESKAAAHGEVGARVVRAARPTAAAIPGIAHATLAGAADGLDQLSIWRQTMQPGASTPPHVHDCDEVVLCEAGEGELIAEGRVQRFAEGDVLVLPRNRPHQFRNVGAGPLRTLAAFGASPVGTRGPDGAPLNLPWRT